jgi:phosphatidylserine/phosphatidylglycerophosphate/cardiolipin synthase-like enzyme
MARFESRTIPFPWRDGNRFQLLIDGNQFYPAMLHAIAAADNHVLLEMYLMESGEVADRFIAALLAAAERGVAVYLLLDDFGARGLQRKDRERLQQGNITVVYYNRLRYGELRRNFFRDHRKLLVVDSRIAFVGGAGITDEFDPPHLPERRWRETMVAAEGPVVVDWQSLFCDTWRHAAGIHLTFPTSVKPEMAGTQRGRVNYSRGILYPEITRTVINRTRGARNRIWLAMAYFVPSVKLRRSLRQAARRGVDVRLLLPGNHTDHPAVRHAGRRFYSRLLRHGVRIFEYQPRFSHSKVVACDEWVSIGSSNIDRWTLHWNLEANQEIDDTSFAEQVCLMLEQDFRNSRECLFTEWRNRPWYRRLRESFWGRIDIWIERLFHRPPPRPPQN